MPVGRPRTIEGESTKMQWYVGVDSYKWMVAASESIGVPPGRLSDRMIRYMAGQMSKKEERLFRTMIDYLQNAVPYGAGKDEQ